MILEVWRTQRERIAEVGRSVSEHLKENAALGTSVGQLSLEILAQTRAKLQRHFDTTHGGFGHAPKFPHAIDLQVLLRIANRFQDAQALQMVKLTLDMMARGGIYDQVGGGFHRYSVDERWLVPHFEKMLYDNALLTIAYVEAFQFTGESAYATVAREVLDYVLREMTTDEGAFFSTQDADSEREEGKFYLWSEKEIHEVLGAEFGEFACRIWGTSEQGNFEGHNILCRSRSDELDAARVGLTLSAFRSRLEEARRKLYEVRSRRIWPGRDEKILTSWNGLMIAAFARAGVALHEEKYSIAAMRAAHFALTKLRGSNGRLFRTTGVGQPGKLRGYLEDYSFLIEGLLAVYDATLEVEFLQSALELAELMLAHFADRDGPGFFFTADDHEELIARTKDSHDGSTPSGTAMAVTVLLKLAKLCNRNDFADKAEQVLMSSSAMLSEHPSACGQLLVALDLELGPIEQVVIVGTRGAVETVSVIKSLREGFHPRRLMVFHDPAFGPPPKVIANLLQARPMIDGQVTTYTCENFQCQAPRVGMTSSL